MADETAWRGCELPQLETTSGRFVRVEPYDAARHAAPLFAALGGQGDADLWRYIPDGVPESVEELAAMLSRMAQLSAGPWRTHIFLTPNTNDVLGMASYMRIRPAHGSAEVGCVIFSRKLQRTPAASEAMYLMARHLFDDLCYRRYEWKCHNANEASKRAALRLGFSFEGVFRNDMMVRGESRDTAWFSMIDKEWSVLCKAFEAWLAPENFDEAGRQKKPLRDFR